MGCTEVGTGRASTEVLLGTGLVRWNTVGWVVGTFQVPVAGVILWGWCGGARLGTEILSEVGSLALEAGVGCQALLFVLVAGDLGVEVTMIVLLVETLRVVGVLHSRGH